jgi:hypothetical protein
MQEVEGEDFLRGLYQDLSVKESQLSKLQISFTTVQLSFINQKLSDISRGALRGQRLAHLAKKKPLDHNELLDFQYYLEQIGKLRVASAAETLDEMTIVDLAGFKGVYRLEVIRCKPKILYNFSVLAKHLTFLSVDRSIGSICELLGLAKEDVDAKPKPGDANSVSNSENGSLEARQDQNGDESGSSDVSRSYGSEKPWAKLQVLNAAHNYISLMDDSLLALSALEVLDLSYNLISRVENLQFCYCLVQVNLSHNRIRSVQNTVETFGNLKFLNLSGNELESALGLEKLLGLERLDLSDNQLLQPIDVQHLQSLPNLTNLELRGNPLAAISKWRSQVYALLLKEDLAIDGTGPSSSDKAMMETSKAAQPLVPWDAGHSTISKIGTIETPKPAFGAPGSGRALTAEFSDPTMAYHYPALLPSDRQIMAEVSHTAPSLQSRPKTQATQGSGTTSSAAAPTAAQIAQKRKQKHPKRKTMAEIANPTASPLLGGREETEGKFGDFGAISSSGKPLMGAMDASDSMASYKSFKEAMGVEGEDKDMGQILQWAEEERWLLNYNAYRKRLEALESQREAERQAEQAALAGPSASSNLSTSGEALPPSSDAIAIATPSQSSQDTSSSLSTTPGAPGSGNIRRKFQEVKRQTLLMPSTFTADMLSDMDPSEDSEEYQQFTQSTLLKMSSSNSTKRRPVTMISPRNPSPEDALELSPREELPALEDPQAQDPTILTSSPSMPSLLPPSQSSPDKPTSTIIPLQDVAPSDAEQAAKTEISESTSNSASIHPNGVESSTNALKSSSDTVKPAGSSRSLRLASNANSMAPSAVEAAPSTVASAFAAAIEPSSAIKGTREHADVEGGVEKDEKVASQKLAPEPSGTVSSVKLPVAKSSKYKFNPVASEAAPSASSQLDSDFAELLQAPALSKSGVLSLKEEEAPKSVKTAKLVVASAAPTSGGSETLSTDEYLVSTPSATDASVWEDRILIVNMKSLEEWDTQGSVVLRLEAKELVDVSVESGDSVVELSYGNVNPRSYSPHSTLVYKMDSEEDVGKLVKLMKSILSASSKKIKCMSCQSIFTMQKMIDCAKCGSSTLMVFESGQTVENAENPISAPGPSSGPVVTPHVEDAMDAAVIPMNRQIYMRTMHLKDEASGSLEEMLAYFPCWHLPYNSTPQKEQRASLVLGETKLVLLIKRRARKGSVLAFGKTGREGVPSASEEDFKEEEVLATIKLTNLRRIVIGPFWQWLRIETTQQNSDPHVLITRSHARTFRFLQLFKQKCGWLEMSNKNKEFISNLRVGVQLALKSLKGSANVGLSAELGELQVDLYFMGYQRVKSGFNLFNLNSRASVFGKESTLVPRSIILTKNNILICEEDYAKWPSLAVPGWNPPKTPQFTILHHFSYHEIVSLDTTNAQEHPNYMAVTFEHNTSQGATSQQQIILFSQGEAERAKFIKILSQKYQEYFHIQLILNQ